MNDTEVRVKVTVSVPRWYTSLFMKVIFDFASKAIGFTHSASPRIIAKVHTVEMYFEEASTAKSFIKALEGLEG